MTLNIKALAQGDEASWELAFRIIKPYVHARARSMTDAASCEDITQEVLLAVWRYVNNGWQPKSIDDLIKRSVAIARNKSRDRLKKQIREPFLEDQGLAPQQTPGDQTQDRADLSSLRKAFEDCLALLTEKLRLPILLRLREGLTFKQISKKIHSESIDTTYSRFNLGRKKLQSCMEGKGFDQEYLDS